MRLSPLQEELEAILTHRETIYDIGVTTLSAPAPPSFWRRHGLGLAITALLILWIALFLTHDPNTRWGAFYTNATADWTGAFLMIFATKHLYERGSRESKAPRHLSHRPWKRFLIAHSLTLFLAATGLIWLYCYSIADPNSRWGQLIGNILSEWTQTIGMVLLTKKLIEQGSKA